MSNVASGNTIAEVADLIGDAARANILSALMGGQPLTAGELARHAGVTPQTTSGHLGKLADAQLISVEKQGRHRYYRLTSPDVAHAIHALMALAANGPKRHHPIGPKDLALRFARTCYDHIAGRLAIAVTDAVTDKGYVLLADGAGLITNEGQRFFRDFGIKLDQVARHKRPVCRTCLDWSERLPHLAGRLGAQLLDRSLELGWIKRTTESRALSLTRPGEIGFSSTFNLPSGWQALPFSQ